MAGNIFSRETFFTVDCSIFYEIDFFHSTSAVHLINVVYEFKDLPKRQRLITGSISLICLPCMFIPALTYTRYFDMQCQSSSLRIFTVHMILYSTKYTQLRLTLGF